MFDELPSFLGLVLDLQNVTFRGNLLSYPPHDILDLGWKGIKQYFKQHLQFTSAGDNNFNGLKVILYYHRLIKNKMMDKRTENRINAQTHLQKVES